MDRERAARIALALTPGVGAARLDLLVKAFGSGYGALEAPLARLRATPGVTLALATAVAAQTIGEAERAIERTAAQGGVVLLPDDPDFPKVLRDIPDPPTLLFARGRRELLGRPALAVVGSRDHTPYGGEVCRAIAAHAAGAGVVVVSGMARGLDALAHGAALDGGGDTIGVLGNGLGVIYPAANRSLYERVSERGLLLTEFPPGEKPNAGSFPRRNRLIAGLARATVIVEAAAGSGALITAGAALDQGGDVIAVPGPITSPTSVGCNRLIRDGAAPLTELEDLHGYFPEIRTWPAETAVGGGALRELPATLSLAERELAAALGRTSLPADALAERLGRPPAVVLAQLGMLEIAGVVERSPFGVFRRV
ncbi:MAG TPA: DNA-processing protein DprA [Gemmatimonadales bacterium]|nr:DNA-processing protein DprA [Gemmatimonadales bacterium]